MSHGALILDLDGTLVDSVPAWIEAFLETFATYGIEMTREEFIAQVYQQHRPLNRVLVRHGILDQRDAFREARDINYGARLRSSIVWLPGGRELLEDIGDPSQLAIVTNSWRRYVEAIDARLGVTGYVGCVLAHEDVDGRTKPEPYPLLLAAERLGADPTRSVYVGDQTHDMTAARDAGMTPWLVESPLTPPAAHDHAARVFSSVHDVTTAWAEHGAD